jgi:hypothetical protein
MYLSIFSTIAEIKGRPPKWQCMERVSSAGGSFQ